MQSGLAKQCFDYYSEGDIALNVNIQYNIVLHRVRSLKFATYLKFTTCRNIHKINRSEVKFAESLVD